MDYEEYPIAIVLVSPWKKQKKHYSHFCNKENLKKNVKLTSFL